MAAVGNWTFRGTSLYTGNVKITEIGGFTALPPLRGDDFLTMGRTGRLFVPKIHDEKHITLKIELLDVTLNSVQALLDQYATLFSNRAQGTLVYTDYNSVTRSAQAEVVSWTPVHGPMAKIWTGIVDFLLADPWLYGAQVTGNVTPNAGISIYSTATNAVSATARTSYALTLNAAISGQPIIVCHSAVAAAATVTSIADTFGGHYTYVKVDNHADTGDSEIWIGTGGTGTSGVVTVTCASGLTGGTALALQGASTSAGLAAIDVHGNASIPAYSSPTLTLTPTASGELFIGTLMDNGAALGYPANAYEYYSFGRVATPTEAYQAGILNPTSSTPVTMTFGSAGATVSGICGGIVKGSGAPVTLNITNTGTATAEKITIDILGPFSSPTILNTTNGTSVTISATVASTKHLIVDTGAFTALNDGVNVIGSVTHSGAVPFLTIAPGANALQISGGAATGSTLVTVSFYPPFE